MAVYNMPSSKDMTGGMQAVSDVLNAFGRHERERQDMQMRDALLHQATRTLSPEEEKDPNARWNNIVNELAGFKPSYGGGARGIMQRVGSAFAGPSQYGQSMQNMAIAGQSPDAILGRQVKQAQLASKTGDISKIDQAIKMVGEYTKMAGQAENAGQFDQAQKYLASADRWAKIVDELSGGAAQPAQPKRIETVNLNTGAHMLNRIPTGQVTPVPQRAPAPQPAGMPGQPLIPVTASRQAGLVPTDSLYAPRTEIADPRDIRTPIMREPTYAEMLEQEVKLARQANQPPTAPQQIAATQRQDPMAQYLAPNTPPAIREQIDVALRNGYTLEQILQAPEVRPYLQGAK